MNFDLKNAEAFAANSAQAYNGLQSMKSNDALSRLGGIGKIIMALQ